MQGRGKLFCGTNLSVYTLAQGRHWNLLPYWGRWGLHSQVFPGRATQSLVIFRMESYRPTAFTRRSQGTHLKSFLQPLFCNTEKPPVRSLAERPLALSSSGSIILSVLGELGFFSCMVYLFLPTMMVWLASPGDNWSPRHGSVGL